jgi:DNA-binding transcriptional regulator PaaX
MNKAEDWLALLLYGADLLLNPSPAKIVAGCQSREDRQGLGRHLRRLQQRQLLRSSRRPGERALQLTDRGRLLALGGRDPFDLWRRQWDGKRRMRQERADRLHAVSLDPLLPQGLLPPVYLGQKAAAIRQQALATARKFLSQ